MLKYLYIILLFFFSCTNEEIYFSKENNFIEDNYDIILLIGQSNTLAGEGLDLDLDAPNEFVKQLGRFNENNLKIIDAIEPLDNHTKPKTKIGFAFTFSKSYVNEFLEKERKVLIIPCGAGATGFINNYWNKDDDLYKDAVYRTNHILKNTSNSKLVAILWHQGESDVINPNYKENLDTFINDIRKDVNNSSVPFILGGMVPYWVNQEQDRINQQEIISDTPNRIVNSKYANPNVPFTITKKDNEYEIIHYDASGMRELGRRYFSEFRDFSK